MDCAKDSPSAAQIISRAIQDERNLTFGQVSRVVALITLFLVVVAPSGAAQATFNADEFESIWEGV